ncbi:hypothetical protein PHLCEN_2v5277 [Hermanssonia centrifuga]|uniref:BRCT domain-containing protein n=1 Tax=Hermanssonia centrifuga TaxID=98765 RepID=A0A2R6P8P7_9APHY|nr:hypothetical protein PHLCEN_2v5277 [Hermanssonia centrifuga]
MNKLLPSLILLYLILKAKAVNGRCFNAISKAQCAYMLIASHSWGPIVSEIFQSDAADSIPVQRGGRAQPPFRTNNIPSEKALLASPGNVQLSDVDVFDKGDEVRMNKASRYNSEVNDTSRVVSNKGTRVPGLNQKQQCPAAVTAAIPDGLTLLPIATTLPAEPKTITDVAAGLEFMKRSVANNASKIARAPKSVPMTAADSSVITTPASSAKSNAASTSPARNASAGASTSRTRKSTTSALVKKTKSKKEKSVLMLPCDYARKLQQMVASGEMRLYSKRYLEGKIIYYFGGDFDVATQRTREKMEFLIRHGATLLPQFDPERVTHIISDGPKATFLHSIGVKKIADIHPNIPILKWNWASRSMDNPGRMRQYQDFAAYPERVLFDPEVELQLARARNAKDRKGKGKARAPEPEVHDSESDEEYSRISEFTQDKIPNQVISDNMPRPHPERLVGGSQTSRSSDIHLNDRRLEEMNGNAPVQREDDRRSPSAAAAHRGMDDDPLAEFYTQACAELDAERYKDGEGREDNRPNGTENEKRTNVSSGVDGKFRPEEKRAAVFQCDRKRSELPVTCPNQDVIDKLSELKALHESKLGDDHKWRVYTYNKAIGFLRNHPKRITSIEEARQLRGIGEKTAQKVNIMRPLQYPLYSSQSLQIMEVIQTGDLRRIQYERTEDVEAVKIFTGIYGVGR